MVEVIEKWIDQTIMNYSNKMKSCECFAEQFQGYYSEEFLSKSNFVVLDEIPKIDIQELREAGLSEFIDMDFTGITYKNVYFIKNGFENDLAMHFHELVHILQWQYLGSKKFISRYISELKEHGYMGAPLEKMAYSLEDGFRNNSQIINVQHYVKNAI